MPNVPGSPGFLRQPEIPLHKRALVAYSDSDSESSSSGTPELVIDLEAEAKRMDAAEGLMALSMTKITSADDLVIDNPTPAVGMQEKLGTAPKKDDKPVAEGSRRNIQGVKLDGDDGIISDIADEPHDVKFETTFADVNAETDGSTITPRCWGDIKYPRIGTCDHEFKIVNKGERYRKVVSDFFGRNKKATASVPSDCYPKICRTCYQRLAYRLGSMNKDDPEKDAAAIAKLRCDAIIAALEKMKEKKFVDRHGYEWPWWCGLELQLTNDGQALLDDPEGLEAEIEKKNGEVAKNKVDKANSPQGKFKRMHKRVKPEYLPDWLQNLCQANTGNSASNDVATSTIGDRNGVRYSFDELILVIKAIKTFCHESRCAFPTIEAVPVPIGLLDEQILKEKRKIRATANKMKTETKKAAADAERDARDQPSNTLRKKKATKKRKDANDALVVAEAAERAVDNAQDDALLSAETIPGKRHRPDATPSKASEARFNLNKMRTEKVPESPRKTIKKGEVEVSEGDFRQDDNDNGDADDGDYGEDTNTTTPRPAKRARTSTATPKTTTRNSKGTYADWKRKYGKPLPPPASWTEVRARTSDGRRDGYYPEPHKEVGESHQFDDK